jgi:hypothetical protein
MTRIRSMAIKNLDKLASPARKISLGRKYDHPTWIPEGFMTLCLQADFLTEEEAGELELKDIVGCATARERIRAKVMDVAPGTSVFSSTRLGNSRARIGIYEDGIKYMGSEFFAVLSFTTCTEFLFANRSGSARYCGEHLRN